MFDQLIMTNKRLIKKYANNKEKLEVQLLIKKLLSSRDCFRKMSIEQAYGILRDLEIPEASLRAIYEELI